MSIIYDALKKAERERQPSLRRVPLHRLTPRPHRRGRWALLAAFVLAVGAGSGFATWVWLASKAAAPTASQVPGTGAAQARTAAASGMGSQPTKEPAPALPPLKSGTEMSRDANPSPAFDPQITVDVAVAEARRAEEAGQWEEAVQRYRQVIALDPTLLEVRNNLGLLYVRLNRFAEAIDAFQGVLARAPDQALARNNLGSAYLLSGQEHLAIQEFLAAVRLDGAYVTPYYNLASVYARRGDAGGAMTFLTKAMALEPAVLSWAREDPDFAGVWDSPVFRRWRSLRAAR
jgi:Flp pilus assembly protein TadD